MNVAKSGELTNVEVGKEETERKSKLLCASRTLEAATQVLRGPGVPKYTPPIGAVNYIGSHDVLEARPEG